MTLSKAGSESATSTPANGEPNSGPTTSRPNAIVTAPVKSRSNRHTVAWCAVSAPRSLMSSRIHRYPWPSAAPTAQNPTMNKTCAATVAWAIRLMNIGRVMPRPCFGLTNSAMGHSPHRPRRPDVSKARHKVASGPAGGLSVAIRRPLPAVVACPDRRLRPISNGPASGQPGRRQLGTRAFCLPAPTTMPVKTKRANVVPKRGPYSAGAGALPESCHGGRALRCRLGVCGVGRRAFWRMSR